jgi:hypothetical protein
MLLIKLKNFWKTQFVVFFAIQPACAELDKRITKTLIKKDTPLRVPKNPELILA